MQFLPGNHGFQWKPLASGLCMRDRRSNRTKTYHPARILVEGSTIYHCTVHNFTRYGVCIELPFAAEELPDKFEFSLDHFQTFYVCNTIWREDYVAGVSFDTPPPISPENRRAKLKIVASHAEPAAE